MSLLKHQVEMLRLKHESPWPSRVREEKERIKKWRAEQRVRLVTKGESNGLQRSEKR